MSDSDPQVLLKKVPADGTSIGNQSLREVLGWNEKRYDAARDALIEAGTLVKGRSRGGSVKRITAGVTKPPKGNANFAESDKLEQAIKANLKGLGYGN
jgi:hypothetical protein